MNQPTQELTHAAPPIAARDLTPTPPPAAQAGSKRRLLLMAAVVALALGAWLWSRSQPSGPEPGAAAKPARDVPYLDGPWIRYSQGFADRNKLEFAPVGMGSLAPVVHVTGTVDFDPDRVAAIGARIQGRVRSVLKLEGDLVKPGDVLAEIESAELGGAQAALISARAHALAALANERRERELAQAKISSSRDFELAAAAAASARADLLAAENRVKAMGGKPNGEPGVLQLQSPIAGRVVTRSLSRGQFVEPTLTAFKVADLSRVFVQLAVFEREVPKIRAGDEVELSAPGVARPQLKGHVAYVGDEIDLQTKTAAVRVIVEQQASPFLLNESAATENAFPAASCCASPNGNVAQPTRLATTTRAARICFIAIGWQAGSDLRCPSGNGRIP